MRSCSAWQSPLPTCTWSLFGLTDNQVFNGDRDGSWGQATRRGEKGRQRIETRRGGAPKGEGKRHDAAGIPPLGHARRTQEPTVRRDAAKAAAPYCHARLASTEL